MLIKKRIFIKDISWFMSYHSQCLHGIQRLFVHRVKSEHNIKLWMLWTDEKKIAKEMKAKCWELTKNLIFINRKNYFHAFVMEKKKLLLFYKENSQSDQRHEWGQFKIYFKKALEVLIKLIQISCFELLRT